MEPTHYLDGTGVGPIWVIPMWDLHTILGGRLVALAKTLSDASVDMSMIGTLVDEIKSLMSYEFHHCTISQYPEFVIMYQTL